MATYSDIPQKLLDQLACPLTKAPLRYDAEKQWLISEGPKLAFPIKDGVPDMRLDHAISLDDE